MKMNSFGDIVVFWFRRDLRLEDNTALYHALSSGYPVLPIFIFDTKILQGCTVGDARISFIHKNLKEINEKLGDHNSSLYCSYGEPAKIWLGLLKKFNIKGVFINKDYEPYARERDEMIASMLADNGAPLHKYKDQVIYEENEILKQDDKPYTVYTPFKRKWLTKFSSERLSSPFGINHGTFLQHAYPFPTLAELGFEESKISVRDFNLDQLEDYSIHRNFPWMDGTSYLGPHLRFGTISIRQVLRQIDLRNESFINELIWREFFMQILFHFPHVIDQNFRAKYDGIDWRNAESEFERWCKGFTGYPLVDAGMRQLNETGYMHNRVRMVTASFLCKHLLIDWRWGEAYFASKLLDYELSSNNGNWQWAAGTGCDAAPYFRVFNPAEQQKKFDDQFKYVKRWVPEFGTSAYPEPMIDHALARQRALEVYKAGIKR